MKTITLRLLLACLLCSAILINACNDSSSPVAPPVDPEKTPELISIDPTFGKIGEIIVFKGRNFGTVQGSSYVEFNGGKVPLYKSWNDSMITVEVPFAAVTGDVKVVVGTKSSNVKAFKLGNEAGPPTIFNMYPTHGQVGDTITISGQSFGNERDTMILARFLIHKDKRLFVF